MWSYWSRLCVNNHKLFFEIRLNDNLCYDKLNYNVLLLNRYVNVHLRFFKMIIHE